MINFYFQSNFINSSTDISASLSNFLNNPFPKTLWSGTVNGLLRISLCNKRIWLPFCRATLYPIFINTFMQSLPDSNGIFDIKKLYCEGLFLSDYIIQEFPDFLFPPSTTQ